jgi:hypothetical protein
MRSTNKRVSAPVHGRRLMARVACVVVLDLTAVIAMPQAAASSDANRTTASTTDDANAAHSVDDSTDGALTPAEADALLGATDGMPGDRVWTLVGEADGVHVLSAVQADGYAWTDMAVLGTELGTTWYRDVESVIDGTRDDSFLLGMSEKCE